MVDQRHQGRRHADGRPLRPSWGKHQDWLTTIGTVTATYEENWSTTKPSSNGTQYYGLQGTYRGDVALVRLKSTLSSAPRIYRGGPTSSTSSPVIGKFARYAYLGEWVLMGGQQTGETGPFQVVDVHSTWPYTQNCGPDCWVRNVTRASLPYGESDCPIPGDSGGSVFHFPVSSSGVTAAGTYSGQWGADACNIVYTDIHNSFLGLPGDIWD